MGAILVKTSKHEGPSVPPYAMLLYSSCFVFATTC